MSVKNKTKTFNFGIYWQVYGNTSVEVPIDYTTEKAMEYVREHWDDVDLPGNGEYVQDSDEPDFDCCDFDEV